MSGVLKTIGTIATVVAGVALIGSGIGAALGGTMMFTALGASVAASTIATVAGAVSLAASLGASALTHPSSPATSDNAADRLKVSIDPRTTRKFVLGHTAMATDIRDQEFSDNQDYLHRFIVCASHKSAGIDEIWFDDKMAWSQSGGVTSDFAGYFDLDICLEGSAAEAVDLSPRMGTSRRYTGMTYVYFRYKLTGNDKKATSPFAQSIPSRVTIIGSGASTYDPRLDGTVAGGSGPMRADDQTTWFWNDDASRNPALQLLWYLLGWRIQNPSTGTWRLAVGKGIPAARIDLGSFITAANLCDEPVTLAAGGTQPRYRSDGVFSEGDATGTVLDQLKAAMNAELDDVDGKIRITVLHNDLATPIADFDDDDVLGEFTWDQTAPLNELYNVVRGTYIDPSTTSLYQAVDYPEVRIDSLDGIDRVETVDFQTVEDASQAQRLVKQRIARMLYSGKFTATFSYRAWKVQKNDVVRLTFGALGWTTKLFRVIEATVQVNGQVPMVLQVENADIYLWDRDERPAIQPVQPTSYDPYLNPVFQDVVDPKYEDGTSINDLRPAEPGATDGASPAERDLLAELQADTAQAELDIAAAQQTITNLQSDAAATQAALTQAQNDIIAAQADILANGENIQTLTTTVGDQGASITTLQQTANNQAGQLSTLSQTVATQDGQITTNATAITTLQGTVSSLSTTVSAQGSSITQLQTASSTQAGQIATLTTTVSAGRQDILPNGDFSNGLAGWTASAGGGWAVEDEWTGRRCTTSVSGAPTLLSPRFPVQPGSTITAGIVAQDNRAANPMYMQLRYEDAAGGNIQYKEQVSLAGALSRKSVTGDVPTGAVYGRLWFASSGSSSGYVELNNATVVIGSVDVPNAQPTATITQTFTAVNTVTTQVATLSTTVSTQGSSITQAQTAISALQSSTAMLTTQVTAGRQNLLPNGDFSNGLVGWTPGGAGGWSVEDAWSGRRCNTSASGIPTLLSPSFAVTAGGIFTIGLVSQDARPSSGMYIQCRFESSTGSIIWGDSMPLSKDSLERTSKTFSVPAGAVLCRLWISAPASDTGYVELNNITVVVGNVDVPNATPTASVAQAFSALSTLDTQYASLSTTVSTQGVTISSQQTAITSLNGLFAKASLSLDVNGYVTGWELNNNGSAGDFTIRSDRFRVIPPGGAGSDGFYIDIDASGRTTEYILANGIRVVESGWLS